MESPISVANYFIRKSLEEGNKPLTPMQLVKLVYIAHGWHLGIIGNPLLNEQVEAWKYGPVLRSVYTEFKEFASGNITRLGVSHSLWGLHKTTPFPNTSMNEFLDGIWSGYSHLSGIDLSALTHKQDTPWDDVWHRRGGKDQKGVVIPNDDIKTHYTMLAKKDNRPVIQEALPILSESMNTIYMSIEQQWAEKSAHFDGVERLDVMRCGRRLLSILDAFTPVSTSVKLTYDKGLYARAELGDGTTLQIEVLFDLDEGDLCNTVVTHYMGSEELTSFQCEFGELGLQLEQIMLEFA